jgi:DNA-binding CsgD family transcriptional regulator/tetratricopeptide (TPR) repeat protein
VEIHSRTDPVLDAEEALAAGRTEHARELLELALAEQDLPEERARIHQLRAWLDVVAGTPLHAYERLLTEAEGLAGERPDVAADLLADAALTAVFAGEQAQAREAAGRARELVAAGSAAAPAVDLCTGVVLLLGGDVGAGERLIRSALAEAGEDELSRVILRLDATALYWTEEYELAAAILDRLIEHGRRTRHRLLPGWLDTRAAVDFRLGRWNAADARSAEARRLATALGQTMQVASCLTTSARIAAARGREAECRAKLEDAAALAGGDEGLQFGWTRSAAGLLELGLGRVEQAIETLEPLVVAQVGQVATDPSIALASTDLVEAYTRSGRREEALALCDEFDSRARGSGRSWAIAALYRCRGLLAPPAEIDAEFSEAIRHHRVSPTPFELARTELCYGERLRRARRRRDASTYLRSALGAFVQLGASGWADRARRELAATGGRGRGSAGGLRAELTAHELRVSALVERGLRNRDIAAVLFVTERTVEYHLTNIYGKLGVRSRTELMRLLGQPGGG